MKRRNEPMKNTNKMNRMTEEMKAFQHMRNAERNEKKALDAVLTEEDVDPAELLMKASGLLLETSLMVAKAAFLVSLMDEDEDEAEDSDSFAPDDCASCPYGGDCGSRFSTMVLMCRPGGDNTILTMEELTEELGDIFGHQEGSYDMKPIPETEDLYYVIPEKKPLTRGGKAYFRQPAVVFAIDEDAGEVVSPAAGDLYAAARYFEKHSTTIRLREGGEAAVFCFD